MQKPGRQEQLTDFNCDLDTKKNVQTQGAENPEVNTNSAEEAGKQSNTDDSATGWENGADM